MTIERKLMWRQHPEAFEDDAKRILLALSIKKWLWRTLESIQRATGLSHDSLVENLAELIERSLVKVSVQKTTREPIFGLWERVGGRSEQQQRLR
mgnify:CR=1 FL=1